MGKSKNFFSKYPRISGILIFFLSSVMLLTAIEAGFWLFLKYPKLNLKVKFMLPVIKNIYMNTDINSAQFLPECAQYDSLLIYTLRPGECTFRNREFETVMKMNSMGFRDDEASLDAPEVIVLGDSYSMGWGVEQEETYAQVFEKLSGKKTLNTGVASYFTAKQMMLLDRLDLSNLEFVFIQYCMNDFKENEIDFNNDFQPQYYEQGYIESIMEAHKNRLRYLPLRYLSMTLKFLFTEHFTAQNTLANLQVLYAQVGEKNERSAPPANADQKREAEIFLEILKHSADKFTNVKIVVYALDHVTYWYQGFEQNVCRLLEENDYPAFMEEMTMIKMTDVLDESHYFIIDPHLNANGHLAVARKIFGEIGNDCSYCCTMNNMNRSE